MNVDESLSFLAEVASQMQFSRDFERSKRGVQAYALVGQLWSLLAIEARPARRGITDEDWIAAFLNKDHLLVKTVAACMGVCEKTVVRKHKSLRETLIGQGVDVSNLDNAPSMRRSNALRRKRAKT